MRSARLLVNISFWFWVIVAALGWSTLAVAFFERSSDPAPQAIWVLAWIFAGLGSFFTLLSGHADNAIHKFTKMYDDYVNWHRELNNELYNTNKELFEARRKIGSYEWLLDLRSPEKKEKKEAEMWANWVVGREGCLVAARNTCGAYSCSREYGHLGPCAAHHNF